MDESGGNLRCKQKRKNNLAFIKYMEDATHDYARSKIFGETEMVVRKIA